MILIAKAAHMRYGGCRSCSETFQKFATLVILEHVVNGNVVFLHAESHIVAFKSRTAIESIVVKRARDRWLPAFETPS